MKKELSKLEADIIKLNGKILGCESIDEELQNSLLFGLHYLKAAIHEERVLRLPLAAAIFDLASLYPTNKYGKMEEKEFNQLEMTWLAVTDELREILNS